MSTRKAFLLATLAVIAVGAAFLCSACAADSQGSEDTASVATTTPSEDVTEFAKRYLEAWVTAWTHPDVNVLAPFYAEDVVFSEAYGGGVRVTGRDAVAPWLANWPDSAPVIEYVGTGDGWFAFQETEPWAAQPQTWFFVCDVKDGLIINQWGWGANYTTTNPAE